MRYVLLLLPLVLGAVAWQLATPPTLLEAEPAGEAREVSSLAALFTNPAETDAVTLEPPTELYKVLRVIDGDTIVVRISGEEKTVRYIGVDTPETVHPERPVQCFGAEASTKNKQLVEGAMVSLERDISDTDKYGRLLRYVYAGETFVNYELVAGGYARSLTFPPDVKHNELLRRALTQAREAELGLWGTSCSTDIVSGSNDTGGSCTIKGNINSSGNKLFHTPSCPDYETVNINEIAGERWFCSENDAFSAGWRKAGNCNQL